MKRITGTQARDLLDRVQPVGNWDLMIHDGEAVPVVVDRERNQKVTEAADCDIAALIVRAPDLAETVAWLYGREPDAHDPHRGPEWNVWPKVGYTTEGDIRIVSERSGTGFTMPKLAAIELARALLAAAERGRNAGA